MASQAKDQASGALDQAKRGIGEQASGLMESAKGAASAAGEKLLGAVNDQKSAGAEFISGMAGSLRNAAKEFESNVPQAAPYMRSAADQIDAVANALKRRDIGEIVGEVQDFARRQPTAFFGAAVVAGFAAVRFLKSSSGNRSSYRGGRSYRGASGSASSGRPDDGPYGNWVGNSQSHLSGASPSPVSYGASSQGTTHGSSTGTQGTTQGRTPGAAGSSSGMGTSPNRPGATQAGSAGSTSTPTTPTASSAPTGGPRGY